MTELTDIEALVSRELHDTTNATYALADVDRALTQAIEDYSRASPIEVSTTKATTASSRIIALDSTNFPNFIRVLAVEYPISKYPEHRPSFEVVDTNLYLHCDELPTGANARIIWHKPHALPGAATTIPTRDRDLIVTGAVGYCLQNFAISLLNKLNTTPTAVADYRALADSYLQRFRTGLEKIARKLKSRQLASTAPTTDSKTTDWGP